jgi:hypothetical protein
MSCGRSLTRPLGRLAVHPHAGTPAVDPTDVEDRCEATFVRGHRTFAMSTPALRLRKPVSAFALGLLAIDLRLVPVDPRRAGSQRCLGSIQPSRRPCNGLPSALKHIDAGIDVPVEAHIGSVDTVGQILFPLVEPLLARIGTCLPDVGDPIPLVRDPLPLVGNPVSLGRDAVPIVSNSLPLIARTCMPLRRPAGAGHSRIGLTHTPTLRLVTSRTTIWIRRPDPMPRQV